MSGCRLEVPPQIKLELSRFHPLLKSKIRAGLDEVVANPYCGKALKEELTGCYSFRTSRYRIVYEIHPKQKKVRILAIGNRKSVYQNVNRQS